MHHDDRELSALGPRWPTCSHADTPPAMRIGRPSCLYSIVSRNRGYNPRGVGERRAPCHSPMFLGIQESPRSSSTRPTTSPTGVPHRSATASPSCWPDGPVLQRQVSDHDQIGAQQQRLTRRDHLGDDPWVVVVLEPSFRSGKALGGHSVFSEQSGCERPFRRIQHSYPVQSVGSVPLSNPPTGRGRGHHRHETGRRYPIPQMRSRPRHPESKPCVKSTVCMLASVQDSSS